LIEEDLEKEVIPATALKIHEIRTIDTIEEISKEDLTNYKPPEKKEEEDKDTDPSAGRWKG